MTKLKYCPHCQQNVVAITKPSNTAIALCFFGFPFLVGANSSNNFGYAYNPRTALATLVIFIALFQFLIAIGWIIGILSLLFRRSYCPICRTPSKFLQPQKFG